MNTPTHLLRHILLATALALGVVLPGFSAPGAIAAAGMKDMHHSSVDLLSCINQHQSPNVPVAKEPINIESDDNEDPYPPFTPFYARPITFCVQHIDPHGDIVISPAYLPPDIILLTSSLRI